MPPPPPPPPLPLPPPPRPPLLGVLTALVAAVTVLAAIAGNMPVNTEVGDRDDSEVVQGDDDDDDVPRLSRPRPRPRALSPPQRLPTGALPSAFSAARCVCVCGLKAVGGRVAEHDEGFISFEGKGQFRDGFFIEFRRI